MIAINWNLKLAWNFKFTPLWSSKVAELRAELEHLNPATGWSFYSLPVLAVDPGVEDRGWLVQWVTKADPRIRDHELAESARRELRAATKPVFTLPRWTTEVENNFRTVRVADQWRNVLSRNLAYLKSCYLAGENGRWTDLRVTFSKRPGSREMEKLNSLAKCFPLPADLPLRIEWSEP